VLRGIHSHRNNSPQTRPSLTATTLPTVDANAHTPLYVPIPLKRKQSATAWPCKLDNLASYHHLTFFFPFPSLTARHALPETRDTPSCTGRWRTSVQFLCLVVVALISKFFQPPRCPTARLQSFRYSSTSINFYCAQVSPPPRYYPPCSPFLFSRPNNGPVAIPVTVRARGPTTVPDRSYVFRQRRIQVETCLWWSQKKE